MTPLLAAGLAGGLAAIGRILGWLTTGGAFAAALLGGAIFAGGGAAGAVWLGIFFVSGSLLGDRNRPVSGPWRGRSARQVLANGTWAALGGVLLLIGVAAGSVVMAGALAAATADTWATEIGKFARHAPRSITTWQPVAPGASGGVTVLGTAGGVLGAAVIALVAALAVGWHAAIGVGIAGTLGMIADSLLGGTVQAVYHCETCAEETERPHGAGHPTRLVRGRRWLGNDGVNLAGTAVGAALAWWLH